MSIFFHYLILILDLPFNPGNKGLHPENKELLKSLVYCLLQSPGVDCGLAHGAGAASAERDDAQEIPGLLTVCAVHSQHLLALNDVLQVQRPAGGVVSRQL